MIFPTPHPTYWDDPGPFPVSNWRRSLFGKYYDYVPLRAAWVEQWKAYLDRLEREAEAYQMWLDQQAEYQLTQQLYMERGHEIADQLPYELHNIGLSYRRRVQDRKDERPYEKVDYCHVEQWYYDEYAFYFWIATWFPQRPYGVTIDRFFPNNEEDNPVSMTLAGAFGAPVTVEFNHQNHQRPGLWIVVEHRTGRGNVPHRVSYQQMMQVFPKTASPLAWPVGVGKNKQVYMGDLGEIYNMGIGGSPGGGKSNQINVILTNFISRNSPKDLRILMVDFKRVELFFYRDIPHLGGDTDCIIKTSEDKEGNLKQTITKTVPLGYEPKEGEKLSPPVGQQIITEPNQFPKLLDYLLAEIERRTKVLVSGKVKKISTWNKRRPDKKLSYWVLVIDELGDVMLRTGSKKTEEKLVRIFQLGRALGIYCIVATQTPKSNVITELIKNNITAWIAFRCGTGISSGLMLNGKWDAARLPAIPGRSIFREGDRMEEIQTPEISDLTIKTAVRDVTKRGNDAPTDVQAWTIPPEQVFEYALKQLDGYCAEAELFKHFRRVGVSRAEITDLLQSYQVVGTLGAFEPEIEIGENDEEYYLTPFIKGSRTPRQLLTVKQFEAEFKQKWEAHITPHTPYPQKNGQTGGGHNGKNGKSAQPNTPPDTLVGEPVQIELDPPANEDIEPQTEPDSIPDWLETL